MSKNTGTSELINYFDLGINGDVGIAGSLDINTIANATTDTDTFLVSDTGIIKYRTGAQLLSDIGAAPAVAGGYVPYTGATTNVDLGVYNLTTSAIIANGSGSNSGIVHLESNAIHSLVNGYGSIASGTTNQFNLYQTTGAGVFRGAILSLNSITEFATRTFTLPDADGTIALTSNIPANAVGGTGTTNTLSKFTASTTIGNSSITDDGTIVSILNSSFTDVLRVGSTTRFLYFYPDSGSVNIMTGAGFTGSGITFAGFSNYLDFNTNSLTRMRLTTAGNLVLGPNPFTDNGARLQVSGAATFSDTITSTKTSEVVFTNTSGGTNRLYTLLQNTSGYFLTGVEGASAGSLVTNSTAYAGVITTNSTSDLVLGTNFTRRLLIDKSTGAATFSESVNVGTHDGLDFLNIERYASSVPYAIIRAGSTDQNVGVGLMIQARDSAGNAFDHTLFASSGNVGIGTTSPASERKLTVAGGAQFTFASNSGASFNIIPAANGQDGADFNLSYYTGSAYGPLNFIVGESNRLRINPNGNVLIGTATDNGAKLQVSGTATVNGVVTGTAYVINRTGSDIITTAFYQQDTLPSTANAINMQMGASGGFQFHTFNGSWNNRMTITAGGNVGIGTDSPAANLDVQAARTANLTLLKLGTNNASTGNGDKVNIDFYSYGNNYLNSRISREIEQFSTYAGALTFSTGASNSITERMRITSGGYLKASNTGTYNSGVIHEFYQSLNGAGATVVTHAGASDPYGLEVNFPSHDPNNATNYMFGAYKTSGGFVWIYRIFSNGTVSARSDARWKKNIETTRNGYIDDLCKLRVVKYNWYNHEDDAPKELGLIAQEVEEVFPNLIQIDPVIAKREVEQEDGTIIEEEFEDGVSRSIKTSVLPFMLLKAMQEQQEQIKELQVQIDKLKNL